jgi:hypothetical protein
VVSAALLLNTSALAPMSNHPTESGGARLIADAVDLVRSELARHPEGMRNVDVATATGLNLPISTQPGYITWTILRYLVESGEVTKIGPLYHLVPRA